jgi:quercetin dioxygenase-like cupin family protein
VHRDRYPHRTPTAAARRPIICEFEEHLMYRISHIRPTILLAAALASAPAMLACNRYTTTHMTGIPDDPSVKWGPAPAVFPPGAQLAVMQGDPGASGPFIIRLRLPDGYVIAPHTHPTDENVTVLDGTFRVGMGRTFDESALVAVPAGGFVTAPALHEHYAKAQGVTTVQVDAVGPFALTYVNPADLPKQSVR